MNKRALRVTMAVSLLAVGFAAPANAQAPDYTALDPRGTYPAVDRVPLASRLPTLAGKRIYVVMSWPSGSGMDRIARDIAASLESRHKVRTALVKNRNTLYSDDDPELWKEMKQNADGYLYIGAAPSSTTSYVFKCDKWR